MIRPANTIETVEQSLMRMFRDRAGSILERVTDSVANDSSLVLFAALAAVVAALDILLRVVPCAARVGHEHSHRKAGDGHAAEQTDNASGCQGSGR